MATLLAATMLVAPLPAQAAVGTCTVTTGSDDVNSAPAGSLRACSLLLGGTGFEGGIDVRFQVDSISLVGPIVFSSPPGATVTLTGPVAIDAHVGFSSSGGHERLLVFEAGYVNLDSLTLTDAPDGAVLATGDNYLTVSNSLFSGNRTDEDSLADEGAAINHSGQSLVVENSIFIDNSTTSDAGAIEANGKLVVMDSHFLNNHTYYDGGAISADEDSMIVRSSFLGNYTEDGTGGAIHGGDADEDSATFVAFSTFFGNSSYGSGGAIYDEDDGGETFIAFNTFVDDASQNGNGQSFYSENEEVNALGNIFANESSDYLFDYEDDFLDFGGNFSTSEEGDLYDPRSADPVSLKDLALGGITEFENGTFGFIPSATSIAGGLLDDVEWIEFINEFDSVTSEGFNLDAILKNSNGFFVDQSNNEITEPYSAGSVDFNVVVLYTGPVVTNDPETAQSGSTVTYTGSDLDEVTSATISGQTTTVVSKSPSTLTLRVPTGLAQGMHDVVLRYSTTESLTLQNGLVVQDLMKVWTQLQSDNTVKMYAKNIIGEGKIQFFHNNNEIAWVRATNALNPKLRQANGSSYLVRTRELVDGKNAFEIYQDGKRLWRAAYSN